jgi:hypothetical protein
LQVAFLKKTTNPESDTKVKHFFVTAKKKTRDCNLPFSERTYGYFDRLNNHVAKITAAK